MRTAHTPEIINKQEDTIKLENGNDRELTPSAVEHTPISGV